jgi:cellulose synthase (UDP-forming)
VDFAADLTPTLLLLGVAVLVLPDLPLDSPRARVVVMAISLVAMGRYVLWRFGHTLPTPSLDPAALWMWSLAVFEGLALANAMLTALFLMRRRDRRPDADRREAWLRQQPSPALVDVVIATYNEPLEVLERSVVGALALDWPRLRVWVLDDGRRDGLRQWCEAKGVRWVARPGRDGGKAGNLNAWLAGSAGDAAPFVLVLDADFVPQTNLLWRVMGFFTDDDVGLVQTPQSFFNPDPIQMNLLCGPSFADEQRFFYHHFQPSLDAWGAAFCCGTSFVVRRAALDAVGGIPSDSVTEDMMTTYALAAAGWRTLYLDEPLSAGLAPEGVGEFVNQRARWCLGTVQALRSRWSPLRNRRIGWGSRLAFVNAQLFWLASFPLMLMAVAGPAVYWWTGVPAFLAEPGDFAGHFGPRFAAEAAAILWASRGSVVPLLSGLAPLVTAPAVVVSAARGLVRARGHAFKVTQKGGDRSGVVVHGRMMAWIGGLMAATASGMIFAESGAPAIAIGWSLYALAMLFLALLVCVEVPRRRGHERLPFSEPIRLEWEGGATYGLLEEMSMTGAGIEAGGPATGPVTLEVAGIGRLSASVVRRFDGRLSLRFLDPGPLRDALIRKLYTTPAVLPPDVLDPMKAMASAMRRGFLSTD